MPGFSKIIGRRSSLPVLEHIRFTRDANGGVNLTATDLDSHAIYHVTKTQDGAPLDVLVPFEPLNKLVKGLGNQDVIQLTMDGKKQIHVKYPLAGSFMEQKLDTLPADEFPPLPKITKPGVLLGPEFGVAIKQALQCCLQNTSRPELCGAYVDVSDKKLHYIVASNGTALFAANSFTFGLQKSVIIPDSKFLNWTDLMENGCQLAVEPPTKGSSQGFIQLASGRWTFITRELDARFPHWKQSVPAMTSPRTVIKLSAPAVKQLLEVLPHLPGNEEVNRIIRLKYESGQLKVEGHGKEVQWTGVFIQDATITGKPTTIGLNREYLITALKFNLSEIQIESPLTPLVCINEGRKMVIMPVKLEFPPTAKPAAPQPTTTPETKPEAERKTEMPKTTSTTPKPEPPKPAEPSPTTSLIDQVEQVKETLKNVIRDLTAVIDAVKLAEKEKRASEKEVESVRATLKKLQQVTL